MAWLGVAAAARADGADTAIVVEPQVVHPGDVVTIHGPALWTEVPVTASLVSATGASRLLGAGTTGPDGSLEMRARLPDDVPAGIFRVVLAEPGGDTREVELVVEPALPLIPVAALLGAVLVVALVVRSALRRRGAA